MLLEDVKMFLFAHSLSLSKLFQQIYTRPIY